MDKAARFLNDHRLINRPYGFTPADALECHERARAWLEGKLATKWDGPTVVVSHHAPSLLGTDAKFRNDYLTGAFVSNLEELIHKYSPTIWIHGHTHHCVQDIVGEDSAGRKSDGLSARTRDGTIRSTFGGCYLVCGTGVWRLVSQGRRRATWCERLTRRFS
jgi:hypothetical protein